jgi:hypothetical protein
MALHGQREFFRHRNEITTSTTDGIELVVEKYAKMQYELPAIENFYVGGEVAQSFDRDCN